MIPTENRDARRASNYDLPPEKIESSQPYAAISENKASVAETTFQDNSSYAVSFNTSDDAVLGPIIVYIDKTSLIVPGHGLRA